MLKVQGIQISMGNSLTTRCGGTMTEAQWLAWIRSALRSRWLRWLPRAQALEAARVPYNGPNKRRKYSYRCAICGKDDFSGSEVQVDHFPRDAGSIKSIDDIGNFCNNLFCEVDNLRVLCLEDHAIYTLSQSQGISFEEARVLKKVIEVEKKWPKQKLLDLLATHGYTTAQTSNADKRRAALLSIFSKQEH